MDKNIKDKDITIHTFGCKVNSYDSGLIEKNMIQNNPKSADALKHQGRVHVLNTCAVTSEATQQAVRLIRKLRNQEPDSTIVVTGCAAQVDTNSFKDLPGADLVIANSHKGLLPQILDQYYKGEVQDKVFKSNIFRKEDLEMGGGEDLYHTRSFLKIQDGCNSFCTFCIIPYARGKSRSIPIGHLIERIKELESQRVQEVVLTGVHIGDYEDVEANSKRNLDDLVEEVLKHTSIPRIRLSSLEPIEISEKLLSLYSNSRLCPHFHMSIQSADTEVLKNMKRHYDEDLVLKALKLITNKIENVFIGMDVIAGFPTETDEQFANTYKHLSEAPWTRLHVFPYSERQGTRAATLEQVPHAKRKERAARLRELSLHRQQSEALKQVGKVRPTLILQKASRGADGLTDNYWPIIFSQEDKNKIDQLKLRNIIVQAKVHSVEVNDLDVMLKGGLEL